MSEQNETESPKVADNPKNVNPTSDSQQDVSKKILEKLSKEMIKSTGDYIKEEIDLSISDYKALEQMNKLVTEKYKNLTKHSSNISNEMNKLNESYATLLPMLSQIDDVEKCVAQLELSAQKLDAYSKKLEAKYKQFTEKFLNK